MWKIIYRNFLHPLARRWLESRWPWPPKIKSWVHLRQRPLPSTLRKGDLLIHASSGEIEYAKPFIRKILESGQRSLTITYSSPSAERLLQSWPGAQVIPLPWDSAPEVRKFLEALEPSEIWVARTDLWPEFLTQAKARGIPLKLFAASLPEGTSPLSPGRWPLKFFDEISWISEVDYQRAQSFPFWRGTRHRHDGNPRVDQAITRWQQSTFTNPSGTVSDRPCIVLGSLWEEDFEVWLQALRLMRDPPRIIWVPHEPDRGRPWRDRLMEELRLSEEEIPYWRPEKGTPPPTMTSPHLWVDRVGFLADLYCLADAAFVGGSFKSKCHSILEPSVGGVPVLVGPYFENQPEAAELVAAPEVALTVCGDSLELITGLEKALAQGPRLRSPLREFWVRRSGATARLLKDWLGSTRP